MNRVSSLPSVITLRSWKMSAQFNEVEEELIRIMRSVITALHQRTNVDNITKSLNYFLIRVANTWNSLRLIRRDTPTDIQSMFMLDAGVLLRCMFDASLQAEFILSDSAKSMEQATLYLEF